MCLTAEAFAVFLNMIIGVDMTSEPGRVIVHAEAQDAHWVAVEDEWCTMAPQLDRMVRFAKTD